MCEHYFEQLQHILKHLKLTNFLLFCKQTKIFKGLFELKNTLNNKYKHFKNLHIFTT